MEANAETPDMAFTKELRQATKDVHKISDQLVNAKFLLALSDDAVWADALLAFHELYKFFENNLPEEFLPKELHRTKSFEKDLTYFLGEQWKENYKPRESVQKYLDHLATVKDRGDIYLFAYAYQMYMALMSGGQLLQKKRMIARKLWVGKKDDEVDTSANPDTPHDDLEKRPMPAQVRICPPGCEATFFPEEISILKNKLRTVLNNNYGDMDEKMREQFKEESRNVFVLNADIVRSVKGVNRVNIRRFAYVLVFVVGIIIAIKMVRR